MSQANADRETENINIKNPEHVDYWTQQFGISRETLQMLIEKNGTLASELRLVLGK